MAAFQVSLTPCGELHSVLAGRVLPARRLQRPVAPATSFHEIWEGREQPGAAACSTDVPLLLPPPRRAAVSRAVAPASCTAPLPSWQETQWRVNLEFLRATQSGRGRCIRFNHSPGTLPPQLAGRLHPVGSLWCMPNTQQQGHQWCAVDLQIVALGVLSCRLPEP